MWSTFDHLDINRHPMNFPDWTHSNGLLYSADDHNLLLSIRHQNWIIKIDFNDGHGSGNVLWRLGEGGDFKLIGGTDPTDWFYAQHGMSYFTPNTTGVFRLGVLDNGNDRLFPPQRAGDLQTRRARQRAMLFNGAGSGSERDQHDGDAGHARHSAAQLLQLLWGERAAAGQRRSAHQLQFAGRGAIVQELDPTRRR